ncbi:MAG: DUF5820 family protein [Halobaculum sp.]
MSLDDGNLPTGWQVWNEERDGRVILAFRPDVFDGTGQVDAACMPTIYVANGSPRRRPGMSGGDSDEWTVTLYLEPEVEGGEETYDDRENAIEGAVDFAERFVGGEIDYRELYQVPRPDYFETLDELIGSQPAD